MLTALKTRFHGEHYSQGGGPLVLYDDNRDVITVGSRESLVIESVQLVTEDEGEAAVFFSDTAGAGKYLARGQFRERGGVVSQLSTFRVGQPGEGVTCSGPGTGIVSAFVSGYIAK